MTNNTKQTIAARIKQGCKENRFYLDRCYDLQYALNDLSKHGVKVLNIKDLGQNLAYIDIEPSIEAVKLAHKHNRHPIFAHITSHKGKFTQYQFSYGESDIYVRFTLPK